MRPFLKTNQKPIEEVCRNSDIVIAAVKPQYAGDVLEPCREALKGKALMSIMAGVTSPGGTTIEGCEALERGGFRGAVYDCINAAAEKSKRL